MSGDFVDEAVATLITEKIFPGPCVKHSLRSLCQLQPRGRASRWQWRYVKRARNGGR